MAGGQWICPTRGGVRGTGLSMRTRLGHSVRELGVGWWLRLQVGAIGQVVGTCTGGVVHLHGCTHLVDARASKPGLVGYHCEGAATLGTKAPFPCGKTGGRDVAMCIEHTNILYHTVPYGNPTCVFRARTLTSHISPGMSQSCRSFMREGHMIGFTWAKRAHSHQSVCQRTK